MFFKVLSIVILIGLSTTHAETVQSAIDKAMTGLTVSSSPEPYSKSIQRIYMGKDKNGRITTGIAYRKFDSFETITGLIIVDRTESGFIVRNVCFPDLVKIKNSKNRAKIQTITQYFKNIPFNPHAEKSAVDGLTGATGQSLKASGMLNYMARQLALQMETPPNWTHLPNTRK